MSAGSEVYHLDFLLMLQPMICLNSLLFPIFNMTEDLSGNDISVGRAVGLNRQVVDYELTIPSVIDVGSERLGLPMLFQG